jgi:Flp pilus assembly protein TadG
MTAKATLRSALGSLLARFGRDQRAASAVEFAIVCGPFFFLLMGILQLGIFYMAQSALDGGVVKTAETLRTNFTTGTTATLLDNSALRSSIVTGAGAIIANNGNLSVEIRQLTALDSAVVPISDGTNDYGSTTSTLVLRAQATVLTVLPILSGLSTVYSSALIRRQGT